MTLADWIIGFAFGFGVAVCAVALWRAAGNRQRAQLTLPDDYEARRIAVLWGPGGANIRPDTSPDWWKRVMATQSTSGPDTSNVGGFEGVYHLEEPHG